MSLFIFSSITAAALSLLTFAAAWILSTRSSSDREKTSPFECGFDPKNNARIPFSMRFFLLSIIFIVFDIEIVLLMPMPLLHALMPTLTAFITAFLFLFILLVGLLHEWHQGSLNWST